MTRPARRRRLLIAAAVVAVLASFVVALYQRPVAQWGSTPAERAGAVAGDALVADPDTRWTRSITIDAPPERVWPWLVQMGADKAGFYTYDWGEQLAGDPVHNATTIHPEWQRLAAGDPVRPFPSGEPWVVREIAPPARLVLGGDGGAWSWAFELRPLPGGATRLVTRMNGRKTSPLSYALDVADLVVLPRLLVGVKQRAEGTLPGMPGTHTGDPFPMARLPVQPVTATIWLVVLAGLAVVGAAVGFGAWGRRRRHPWLTIGVAFGTGAAYALTTDTTPVTFVTHTWAVALPLALLAGLLLGAYVPPRYPAGRWPVRAAVAVSENGLLVVLPATVVWQAATARGLTTSWPAHVAVGAVAAAVATTVATYAWSGRPYAPFAAAVLATGYAATGSALVPLLGGVVVESIRRPPPPVEPVHLSERLSRYVDPVRR